MVLFNLEKLRQTRFMWIEDDDDQNNQWDNVKMGERAEETKKLVFLT